MFNNPEMMRRMMSPTAPRPANVLATLRRFWLYFRKQWPILLAVLVFMIVSTWAQVVNPELIGQAVDCYLTPIASRALQVPAGPVQQNAQANCWLAAEAQPQGFTQNLIRSAFLAGGFPSPSEAVTPADRIAGLGRLTLFIVFFYVVGAALTGSMFFTMAWVGQRVLRLMRIDVFKQLHRLSLGYYTKHDAGDLMTRITADAEAIQQALGFAFVNVFSGVLLLVWIAYTMLALSPPFALLSMVVLPFMIVATFWFSLQARRAFRQSRKEMGSVNAELQETIAAVREVQAFNRADENIENFKIVNAANRDANVRAVSFTSALAPTLEALGYVALAIVTCVGGAALLGGGTLFGTTVSLGLIVAFLGYVQRFNQPIQQIAVLWTNLQNAIAGGERIFNLLDEKPDIVDKPNAIVMPPIKGEVTFSHVTAEYNPGDPVLRDVSFTAQPGQTIAIVGPTGAGKTTLVNLIPRFYDVTNGAVMVDGIDVRDVTQESLRRQIGIVLQDTFLFSTTVMENIRFGQPDATDEECIAAAKLAHADQFIERLPQGYQTVLGERGAGLSQGQRQLLAIARAALADPRILILDEATSSVDTRTERLIQAAFDQLLHGRTSFVIAHRLSTIQNADMLLVLNKGRIVERGTHRELLERKGFYYELYMSQFWRGDGPASGRDRHVPAPDGEPQAPQLQPA
ncbi:MAG: ABC transporter [Candidatus Roseilinea sp.]|nr:MAG: ABC transporter [Candidatus Roseilinea sp.]